MVYLTVCRVGEDLEFVAGKSGSEVKFTHSRQRGMCVNEFYGTRQKGRYETSMSLTTSAKKFVVEINRIDWGKKVDNSDTVDESTAKGRLFLYYGTLKNQPGGNLWRMEVPLSGVSSVEPVGDTATELRLRLTSGAGAKRRRTSASTPYVRGAGGPVQWWENVHATFGPYGQKGGRFTPIDALHDQADGGSLEIVLGFETPGAAAATLDLLSKKPAAGGCTADAKKGADPGAGSGPGHELRNATVVFSGLMPGEETRFKKAIEAQGGRVTSAVSGKTTFLVRGAFAGQTKYKKVQELGNKGIIVKVVTPEEFEQMI
ncbi:unnamed protein product [Amoebophrya sp. A120]|nr:unnamed protein product [Amoebophrya sp. A120]|eukprot:GSA120T00023537001.1